MRAQDMVPCGAQIVRQTVGDAISLAQGRGWIGHRCRAGGGWRGDALWRRCISIGIFCLRVRCGDVFGPDETFLDLQLALPADRQHHTGYGAMVVRIGSCRFDFLFDLLEPRRDGVILLVLRIAPPAFVVEHGQLFFARRELFGFRDEFGIGFDILRIDPPEGAKGPMIELQMHVDPLPVANESFGRFLQPLDGQTLHQFGVFQIGRVTVREEIAHHDATGRLISLKSDELPQLGRGRIGRLGEQAFDVLRIDVVAVLDHAPNRHLAIMVICQREGHDAFEIDLTFAEGLENLRRDASELETPTHQIFAHAKTARDFVLGTAFVDHLGKGVELVGRVHGGTGHVFRR